MAVINEGLSKMEFKFQTPTVTNQSIWPENATWQEILSNQTNQEYPKQQPKINWQGLKGSLSNSIVNTPTTKQGAMKNIWNNVRNDVASKLNPKQTSFTDQMSAAGINAVGSTLSDLVADGIFGDSEFGRGIGTVFSQGVTTATDTMANNIIKGTSLTQGLGKNVGSSVAGAGAGLAANYIGKGITSALGDSKLARGIGQGISTGLGALGGTALQGAMQGVKIGNNVIKGVKGATTALKSINPVGLGMTIAGSALGAALGPSKEYGGKYGNITQIADTAYDAITTGVNFIPGVRQVISGALALNKGLSNLFGSTDGMTVQDAILGSAFMPAPVKWLNMWGANTTSSFNNQSWQNSEKTKSFMGNAFGNLQDKFDSAREEAGKTYGLFSQGAYRDAQKNINFANRAWDQVLAMADQNELQNIRSQAMSSINNQRYAQDIQGGWSPLARGKYGMKILNNATNHNIGMRLLSGAALIDNKQMILCSVVD